jgi:hypothetical protein
VSLNIPKVRGSLREHVAALAEDPSGVVSRTYARLLELEESYANLPLSVREDSRAGCSPEAVPRFGSRDRGELERCNADMLNPFRFLAVPGRLHLPRRLVNLRATRP